MKNPISSFFKDETTATAIEYGLVAAGISVAIIVVVGIVESLSHGLNAA
jgi:pilus assembly protein Flp/PilA